MINAGLYIHIPFCRAKCPYCDFYSVPDLSIIDDFLNSLQTEARMYRKSFGTFDSLYLGGGTPTLLSMENLSKLNKNMRETFSFTPDAETTIEANPLDVTEEMADAFFETGFNRISIGVQSFCDKDLRILGRDHTKEKALKSIRILRNKGLKNLNLDLMFAIPGQSIKSWQKTLDQIIDLEPEHISCYQLTVKENTAFFNMYKNRTSGFSADSAQERFFLAAAERLCKKGYIHYEVSNFARQQNLKAYHNEKYWDHSPYLGLGPSAHSLMDGKRWWNISSVPSYIKFLKKGLPPVAGQEVLEKEQIALESLFLGFRTAKGFDLSILDSFKDCGRNFDDIVKKGFAEIRNKRVLPTLKGMLFADAIPGMLL